MVMPAGKRRMMKKDLSKHSPFGEVILKLLPQQGFSNRNYTFLHDDTLYLFREFLLQDREREAEFRIQQAAYEAGIAAKPCHLEEAYMICEFIEGEHKTVFEETDLALVAETLQKLHGLSVENVPRIELAMLLERRDSRIVEAFETIANYPEESVLCHNDLNPKNILFTSGGLKLIDWEFAGVNDRYFDLAAVCVEFGLDRQKERSLMQYYMGKQEYLKAKLDAYKVLYRTLCEEWFEKNI